MTEYLNKGFWIKDGNGIIDPIVRDQWFIRDWEFLQYIEEKEDSVVLCYRNSSRILPILKSVLQEGPEPSFLPNEKVRAIKNQNAPKCKWKNGNRFPHYGGQMDFTFIKDNFALDDNCREMVIDTQELCSLIEECYPNPNI